MPYSRQELRRCLAEDQLRLLYQPKLDARSRELVGVEALVRWEHPVRGLLGPDLFLPAMEAKGLMADLTEWVLGESLNQVSLWRQAQLIVPVAVNVSPTLLSSDAIIAMIERGLSLYSVPPDLLTIEVTETALTSDVEEEAKVFATLRDRGVKVSVDDFGTGYTALSMLKAYTFDELKIDRSFVSDMRFSPADSAIVRSVRELGHRLAISVVAEGVDDSQTADLLTELGCDALQGYYFSRPVRPELIPQIRDLPTIAEPPHYQVTIDAESRATEFSTEMVRASALRSLDILDTPPDPVLDGLAKVAASICGTPMGLISLLDDQRQWFKARVGIDLAETSREHAFCTYAVETPDAVMQVDDAEADPRFYNNPLVKGDPHIRFYAGAPLRIADGPALGTLCVLDTVTRTLNRDQAAALKDLATTASRYIELAQASNALRRLRQLSDLLSTMQTMENIPDAGKAIASTSLDLFGATGVTLLLAEIPGSVRFRPVGIALSDTTKTETVARLVIDSRSAYAPAVSIRAGRPTFVADTGQSELVPSRLVEALDCRSGLYTPITAAGAVVGVLGVWWDRPQPELSTHRETMAQLIANEASSLLSRLYGVAALSRAGQADQLTGFLNRAAFLSRSRRLPPCTAIVLIRLSDLRDIEAINGVRGSERLLKAFASKLNSLCRQEDSLARWSDDTFLVALHSGGQEAADQLVDRLHAVCAGEGERFSSGEALLGHEDRAEDAIERATAQLHRTSEAQSSPRVS